MTIHLISKEESSQKHTSFVHIAKGTTIDSVERFIDKEVKVKDLVQLSHEASKFKPFEVTVRRRMMLKL